MRIHFSALIAVLHHPVRLAEDLAVSTTSARPHRGDARHAGTDPTST
jgi:hypothetical protein